MCVCVCVCKSLVIFVKNTVYLLKAILLTLANILFKHPYLIFNPIYYSLASPSKSPVSTASFNNLLPRPVLVEHPLEFQQA